MVEKKNIPSETDFRQKTGLDKSINTKITNDSISLKQTGIATDAVRSYTKSKFTGFLQTGLFPF